jgi:hypothetical protein
LTRFRIAIAAALTCCATSLAAEPAASRSVTCRVANDPDQRVYRLAQSDGRWDLLFRNRETGDHWIRLALPNAEPVFAPDSVRLTYRNANGGRQADLTVTNTTSALDVWIDYGLEVNIEPDLDPKVDLMNTHGPLRDVRCIIDQLAP